MSETKPTSLHGGCQCGEIRYRIQGVPVEPIAVCHCRMCQKAMGNIFGVFVGFKIEDITWTRRIPNRFQSSSIGYRLFCSRCGTPLAFLPVEQTKIEITVGSLDNPNEFTPVKQIGMESRIVWVDSLANLPGKTTNENDTNAIDVVNYQHPDHD